MLMMNTGNWCIGIASSFIDCGFEHKLYGNKGTFVLKIKLCSRQLRNTGETPSRIKSNETHFIVNHGIILYFKGKQLGKTGCFLAVAPGLLWSCLLCTLSF